MRRLLTIASIICVLPSLASARPAWVDGRSPAHDERSYLTGVGQGGTRSSAENNARARIALIFRAKIESASQDYMASFTKSGAKPIEVQSVENLTKVSTEKTLQGVTIAETWDDGKGSFHALAVLERAPAAAALRERIQDLDKRTAAALNGARKTNDKIRKLRALRAASRFIQQRIASNEELRVVSPDGRAIPPPHSAADIIALLEGVSEELNIGVEVSGSASSDLRQALIEGLTQEGFQVKAVEKDSDDDWDDWDDDTGSGGDSFDMLIRAKSRMERASTGGTIEFARVNVDVEIFNPHTDRVLATFNESRREGHRNIQEASRRAVRAMRKKLVASITKELHRYLGTTK